MWSFNVMNDPRQMDWSRISSRTVIIDGLSRLKKEKKKKLCLCFVFVCLFIYIYICYSEVLIASDVL